MVVHERGWLVFALLADGRLPVLYRQKLFAPGLSERLSDICRDDLMHAIGAVGERAGPICRLGPAVHVGVDVLGGGEPVHVNRDGANAVAGCHLVTRLGRLHDGLGIVVELELHAGNEDPLDLLGHVAIGLRVDRDGHFLYEAEVAALDGVGHLRGVVRVDGLALGSVLGYPDAEDLGVSSVAVVEVVALRRAGLLDEHRAERDGYILIGLDRSRLKIPIIDFASMTYLPETRSKSTSNLAKSFTKDLTLSMEFNEILTVFIGSPSLCGM